MDREVEISETCGSTKIMVGDVERQCGTNRNHEELQEAVMMGSGKVHKAPRGDQKENGAQEMS